MALLLTRTNAQAADYRTRRRISHREWEHRSGLKRQRGFVRNPVVSSGRPPMQKTENEGDVGWQPGQCGADVADDDGHR